MVLRTSAERRDEQVLIPNPEDCRPNSVMQVEAGQPGETRRFEQVVLPHLDAAYNLARWLVRDPHNAEDVVQEACLRAVRFFGGYQGGDARAWLLRIVRNTAYSFLEKNRPGDATEEFNETLYVVPGGSEPDAEALLLKATEGQMLQQALEGLPVRFREALILRELEELSYKEIAEVMEIPIGSVMSALARGREQLRRRILRAREKEVQRGLRG
jgi:RNA polymerase sigma-70 factor (ECF subfamily)